MKLQVVPARTGALWVREGIRTFIRQPLPMGGLFFLLMITLSLPTIIPVLGFFLALCLVPATTAGLMEGTREVRAGKLLNPLVLFVALRQGRAQARAILTLGVLYAVAMLVVMGLSMLIDGGEFVRTYLGHSPLTREVAENPRFRWAMWFSLVLYVPISVVFWHAPALVHWHQVPPAKSLFFSTVAILRNLRAFLVYGLLWACLSAFASATLILVSVLTGSPSLAATSMVVLGLLIAAMFFSSIWFTYRDCFGEKDTPTSTPSAPPEI